MNFDHARPPFAEDHVGIGLEAGLARRGWQASPRHRGAGRREARPDQAAIRPAYSATRRGGPPCCRSGRRWRRGWPLPWRSASSRPRNQRPKTSSAASTAAAESRATVLAGAAIITRPLRRCPVSRGRCHGPRHGRRPPPAWPTGAGSGSRTFLPLLLSLCSPAPYMFIRLIDFQSVDRVMAFTPAAGARQSAQR
jgi:hypothetical protein